MRRILPCCVNQHHLVIFRDLDDADDLAVAIAGLNVDDADAAARLDAILLELGPLAVTLFGHREESSTRAQHFHRDHFVAVAQRDPATP
jgi:hypothetical protein